MGSAQAHKYFPLAVGLGISMLGYGIYKPAPWAKWAGSALLGFAAVQIAPMFFPALVAPQIPVAAPGTVTYIPPSSAKGAT